MSKRKVLGYFCYGENKKYKLELFFSMLSAIKHLDENADQVTISVITDQYDFDPELPIDIILVSPDELSIWTQNGTYNHRAKPFAVQKMVDHYKCPVVMVDTDTYFIKSPLELFERVSSSKTVMHCKEIDSLEAHDSYEPFIKTLRDGIEAVGMRLTADSPMYNSGVIGIDFIHSSLIKKSIDLMDAIYEIIPVFNVEQLAIGTILNESTELTSSDDIVLHYWGYLGFFIHIEIERLFPDFTAKTLENLLKNPFSYPIGFPDKSFRDKLIANLLKLIYGWDTDYSFAYLSYRCAFSYAKKDKEYANAWAKVALSILERAGIESVSLSVRRDFCRFQPDNFKQLPWLNEEMKMLWQAFWKPIS